MRVLLALVSLLTLAACLAPKAPPRPEQLDLKPEILRQAPEQRIGQCYTQDRAPAVFESVTEQSHLGGAQYATKAEQRVLRPAHNIWFATPCQDEMTPSFIASLQRALFARGYYAAEVSGELNTQTRAALGEYQRQAGLTSNTLALATARHLGLLAKR